MVRKTNHSPVWGLFLSFPRKGTETHIALIETPLKNLPIESFPIFSPQGDGNTSSSELKSQRSQVFSYLFPARGRKQGPPPLPLDCIGSLFLSFPRKGTETKVNQPSYFTTAVVVLFLSFPRKGTETLLGVALLGRLPSLFLSFPRKGTETYNLE